MIYLDYQATTPLAPEAFAAMEPWLKNGFANPHSAHVIYRNIARILAGRLDESSEMLADLVGQDTP